MRIQDKYYEIKQYLEKSKPPESVSGAFSDLTKWLNTKKFFGDWGYDPVNHCFKIEPEDPAQGKLFDGII